LEEEALKVNGLPSEMGEAVDPPIPTMPTAYPFKSATTKQATDPNDVYSEGASLSPAIVTHEERQAHLDANPVIEGGIPRPYDSMNDFDTPELKEERTKQIADRVFELANGQVSAANNKAAVNTAIHELKKNFGKSIAMVSHLAKAAKKDNQETFKEESEEEENENKSKDKEAQVEAPLMQEDKALIDSIPKEAPEDLYKATEEEAEKAAAGGSKK